MVQLYLIRHAAAEEAAPGGSDALRSLTAKARKRFHKTARALARKGGALDAIFTSPLVRAVQTAEIVAGEAKRALVSALEDLAPGRSAEELLKELARRARKGGAVALVGHEPQLSQLIVKLARVPPAQAERLEFRAGSVVRIDVSELPQAKSAVARWWIKSGGRHKGLPWKEEEPPAKKAAAPTKKAAAPAKKAAAPAKKAEPQAEKKVAAPAKKAAPAVKKAAAPEKKTAPAKKIAPKPQAHKAAPRLHKPAPKAVQPSKPPAPVAKVARPAPVARPAAPAVPKPAGAPPAAPAKPAAPPAPQKFMGAPRLAGPPPPRPVAPAPSPAPAAPPAPASSGDKPPDSSS